MFSSAEPALGLSCHFSMMAWCINAITSLVFNVDLILSAPPCSLLLLHSVVDPTEVSTSGPTGCGCIGSNRVARLHPVGFKLIKMRQNPCSIGICSKNPPVKHMQQQKCSCLILRKFRHGFSATGIEGAKRPTEIKSSCSWRKEKHAV